MSAYSHLDDPRPPHTQRKLQTAEERREDVLARSDAGVRAPRLLRHADDGHRKDGRDLAGLPVPALPDQGGAVRRVRRALVRERRRASSRRAAAPHAGDSRRRSTAMGDALRRAAAERPTCCSASCTATPRARSRRSATPCARATRQLVELVQQLSGAPDDEIQRVLRQGHAAQHRRRHGRARARRAVGPGADDRQGLLTGDRRCVPHPRSSSAQQ